MTQEANKVAYTLDITYCSNKRLIATIQGRCIECHWQLSKGLYRMDVGLGLMVGPVECGWPWPASRECPYRNCSNTECHWSHDVMRWWCRPPRKHHWPYYQHRQERVGRPTCPEKQHLLSRPNSLFTNRISRYLYQRLVNCRYRPHGSGSSRHRYSVWPYKTISRWGICFWVMATPG